MLARRLRPRRALLFARIALIATPAFADDAGVPLPAAPPSPATVAPNAEGEGDEPEHPTQPTPPGAKLPPIVRQAVTVKDGMARIPGGRFTMGSGDKTAPSNERPARIVLVPPFWIDKTEVTVAAYRACVDRGACPKPDRSSASCTFDLGDPQLPISCVSWAAAQAFCVALGKRLPREVEWELAARGTTPIRYPWGGAATGCGQAVTLAKDTSQTSCALRGRPARVGSHPGNASPFGLYDMSGNVEEWVEDWYTETVSEASPRAGASHVLRGGGWMTPPSSAKTTSRNWGSVREAGPNVGFRCAKDD
jgi:serine/threonine-protein kinase